MNEPTESTPGPFWLATFYNFDGILVYAANTEPQEESHDGTN